VNVEEWRSSQALGDAFVPQVQRDNTVALDAVRVPFATYIVAIHGRFHDVFQEELEAARQAYPELRTAAHLATDVEVGVDRDEGRPVLLGVVKSSGSTVFDAVVLASWRRAGPLGPPPSAIVSPGGRVYVHWTLHTDPHDACAPRNARPYLLAKAP
jgi:hypothetical protein